MSWTERNWDHERDLQKHDFAPLSERHAVAALIGYCEGLCYSGGLGEIIEGQLRHHIAETLAAFKMPSKEELMR